MISYIESYNCPTTCNFIKIGIHTLITHIFPITNKTYLFISELNLSFMNLSEINHLKMGFIVATLHPTICSSTHKYLSRTPPVR